jgi:transglutaminase-like putative cysteine protease
MTRLDIGTDLEYQVLEPSEFIFKIHAASTPRQQVSRVELAVEPSTRYVVEGCHSFGNQHLRFHAEPGPLKVSYTARVEIKPFLIAPSKLEENPVTRLPVDVLQYLSPSRYCPSDRFFQIALQAFGHLAPGYGRVMAICEWVRNRTRFQVGTTTPLNCAMDTFNNGVGVCRDFAHLTISLCRALNIPARYITSIDYGADPMFGPPDFHAYVECYLDGRWYIFDPTGMCPTTGLIRIATGRDANDVAFATIFGRVMWTMPKIRIQAHEDAAAGIELPKRTDLAISTAGPLETARPLADCALTAEASPRAWYKPHAPIQPSFSASRAGG